MTFPKARVVVSGLLFVAWLGYLSYLVAVTRETIVLSRPQILVSNLCVLAKLEERNGRPAPEAQLTEVLWAAANADALRGQTLTIANLADVDKELGWTGPGEYLLPLTKRILGKEVSYEVTALPRTPEFPARAHDIRIYRATADVLRQFHELKPGN
jgi:hypothetical protein